ncbi:Uncharacterized protein cpbgf_1003040 [Cryptosporidium parvum]|uniref:SF-assemblin n=1 Tax=Cryptosporidium parvum TaxID=5807 RepID=A0A7S7LJA4_CRYPV|nr:Uncharacterized protein CPATCC_0036260 [Cryptosporidium parvum]WRK30700.1 Uncharacterized protein cpbgf_1003040 [Cryptosporidium parvum]|eukprot:QOY43320.1 hypothetical protein CPATCC_000097 [Cryptosporidium parvum]
MSSETASIEIGKSAIINSEAIGHKINSLEDKYYSIKRYHESRLKDLSSEIKELSKLINKEQNDIQEIKSIKEKKLREVELKISNQILELREIRNESDTLIENKIKDHLHRMETLEFNKSSEIDIRREDQFEKISSSLNDLTQKVEYLRKRRKNILTSFKKELANESENILKSIQEESNRREYSVQSMKQLLDDTMNHFLTEMAASRTSRLEMDKQIIDQLELACQDTENKLARMISSNENQKDN